MDGQGKGHLFYQSRQRRPRPKRAAGFHLWDVNGKRRPGGPSDAMVSSTGHPSRKAAHCMRFLPKIRDRCDPVGNVTTGGSAIMLLEERLKGAVAASPDEARAMLRLKGAANVGF